MTTNKESTDKGAGVAEHALKAATSEPRDFDPAQADRDLTHSGFRPCPTCGNAQDSGQGEAVALTEYEREWLEYAADHMADDSEPEDLTCERVIRALLARTHPPKPAQVGEKYREPNIEDAVEVLRLAYDGEWQTGEPNIILAALQTIGAVVPAREGDK